MSPVEVNRWRRYGHDRLYVTRADETKVGWWDLATDEPHPVTPDDLAALVDAVAAWRAERAPGVVPAGSTVLTEQADPAVEEVVAIPAAAAVPETPASAERPWIDLATNEPGAEAREQAQAAKDAARVRTFFARTLGVHTDERAWRIGAEERVAAQLAKVIKKDPRWRVIHAIPVGTRGSDIDHLVIGLGGVFTANAKIWVGGSTFMVNGTKQPYIRNARHEVTRTADILSAACGFPATSRGSSSPSTPVMSS